MTTPGTATRGKPARVSTVPAHVPAPASPIVGRETELEDVASRLAGGARLVTIVGPPGTGKTRLAQEVATRVVARTSSMTAPRGGVWWVELATAHGAEDVARAVATTVGAELEPGAGAELSIARVGDALATRGPTLVVLDNFEQVAVHAGATVAAWLARAPSARFLITSRELLRVQGEQELELAPLPLPAPDARTLADIARSPAVQLLLARAAGFEASDEDAPFVADIVRRLEGLPLALELAASRLRLLGVRELAEHMPKPLDLLAHGRRDAASRQSTLRGALDGSWSLLAVAEQRAFARLSLFRGTFDARAAAALVDEVGAAEGRLALDLLQSLRDKSLVARADGSDGPRLRLFESVREYAAEKLEALGDREAAAARLGAWFAQEAELRLAELGGRAQRAAFAWLAAERSNLFAAEDAVAGLEPTRGSVALRIRLLLAVDPVLARLGPSAAHRSRLDAVIAHAESLGLPAALRARAMGARGRAARDAGDPIGAVFDLSRAAELTDGVVSAALRADLGMALLAQGRFDDARRALHRAREVARSAGDRQVEQSALARLGLCAHGTGALDEAKALYTEALDLATSHGDARAEADVRKDLGSLCLQQGRFDEARAHYEDALACNSGGDRRLEGIVLGNLALLTQEQGDLDGALGFFRRAIAALRTLGDRPFEAHLVGYLAGLHHERGDLDEARTTYRQAIAMLREAGDIRLEGLFLAALGALEAASGDLGRAANAFEEADRRLVAVGDPGLLAALDVHRGQLDVLRAKLARADGSADAASTLEKSARERLARAAPHGASSDDVRYARRMLGRALDAEELVIGEGGAWFKPPRGATVDLSTRPTLARVLAALAKQRTEAPGTPLTVAQILEAAWPGEKILARAAQNRVKVAITTLRTLGLRHHLVHRNGYLLGDAHAATTSPRAFGA